MANIAFHISERLDEVKSKDIEKIFEIYNLEQGVEAYKRTDVAIELSDAGKFVGGIEGYSAWNWMHIKTVAIKKEYRGQGYGAKLLELAEQEAVKRGCIGIYLSTMSSQAPEFYESAGFKEYGRLEDYPIGYSRILLKKKL